MLLVVGLGAPESTDAGCTLTVTSDGFSVSDCPADPLGALDLEVAANTAELASKADANLVSGQAAAIQQNSGRVSALEQLLGVPTPVPTVAPSPSPTPPVAPNSCGNGVADIGEQCDGDDLDRYVCQDVVGSFFRCTGTPGCNDQCRLTVGTCRCECEGDFDCDIEIDCSAVVADCFLFGACEDGICVTDPHGTNSVCLGFDREYPEDPVPRCGP